MILVIDQITFAQFRHKTSNRKNQNTNQTKNFVKNSRSTALVATLKCTRSGALDANEVPVAARGLDVPRRGKGERVHGGDQRVATLIHPSRVLSRRFPWSSSP